MTKRRPAVPRRPDEIAWTVFRGAPAIGSGYLGVDELRSPAWVRLRYDVYADARLERDHQLACRAAALTLPSYAVIAGRSAAYLLGVDHAAEFNDPVHIIVPDSSFFPVRAGLIVHQSTVDPTHIVSTVAGPCTAPARTAWDIAAWHDTVTAVPILDALLGRGLVTAGELSELARTGPTVRGRRRARAAIALADGRSQSPPESRLRVAMVQSGLPPPVPQCPVMVAARVVFHLDLGWPEYRVGLEYDGKWHASADQLNRDRRRLNQLASAEWIVLHVTADRLRRDFGGLISEVRQALRARGWTG
jgi:hypothetical protein